ncbi:MAG: hypothetical protein R3F13_11575 [Prosthecobacter sp.]
MKSFILPVICVVGLVSCSTKIAAVPDFDRLPHSKGLYASSLTVTPWQYGASDAQWHHFYYYWFKQNWVHTRRVKIRRDLVLLPFERPVGGSYKTVSMEPVFENGKLAGFKTIKGHYLPQTSDH